MVQADVLATVSTELGSRFVAPFLVRFQLLGASESADVSDFNLLARFDRDSWRIGKYRRCFETGSIRGSCLVSPVNLTLRLVLGLRTTLGFSCFLGFQVGHNSTERKLDKFEA